VGARGVSRNFRATHLAMNEARLSHLPLWGPSEAVVFLIKRPSG